MVFLHLNVGMTVKLPPNFLYICVCACLCVQGVNTHICMSCMLLDVHLYNYAAMHACMFIREYKNVLMCARVLQASLWTCLVCVCAHVGTICRIRFHCFTQEVFWSDSLKVTHLSSGSLYYCLLKCFIWSCCSDGREGPFALWRRRKHSHIDN